MKDTANRGDTLARRETGSDSEVFSSKWSRYQWIAKCAADPTVSPR